MPSLLNPPDREAIVTRLRRLEPSCRPVWGQFTAPAMVCHLADSLRVATGELPAVRNDTWPRRTLMKWLVVYSPVHPPRGKIQTAPEMLTTAPTTWPADIAAVEALIHRLAMTPSTAAHPYFGPLTHARDGDVWRGSTSIIISASLPAELTQPNYGLKRAGFGRRFSWGSDTPPCPGQLRILASGRSLRGIVRRIHGGLPIAFLPRPRLNFPVFAPATGAAITLRGPLERDLYREQQGGA